MEKVASGTDGTYDRKDDEPEESGEQKEKNKNSMVDNAFYSQAVVRKIKVGMSNLKKDELHRVHLAMRQKFRKNRKKWGMEVGNTMRG